MMVQQRIAWLDNLKGVLITTVVLGHTILFTNTEGSGNVLYRIISSFWMPLFMFTSGFASYKQYIGWNIVKRRFFQLMIPYTVWSIVVCLILETWHIEKMFFYPKESMWFLFALFFITLIHVTTCRFAASFRINEEFSVCIISVVLWTIQRFTRSHLFCTDLISYHFLFYILGFYGRKYYRILVGMKSLWYYIMAMLFIIMATMNHDVYMQALHIPKNFYIIYSFLCAFMCLAPMIYFFSKYMDKVMIISKIGGETLGIYVVHLVLLKLLTKYIVIENLSNSLNNGVLYYLFVVLLWQTTFWCSYILTIIIGKSSILSFLLLGKKK